MFAYDWYNENPSTIKSILKVCGRNRERDALYLESFQWLDSDDNDYWTVQRSYPLVTSGSLKDDVASKREEFERRSPCARSGRIVGSATERERDRGYLL